MTLLKNLSKRTAAWTGKEIFIRPLNKDGRIKNGEWVFKIGVFGEWERRPWDNF